jgi:hypothetical protein
VDVHCSCNFSAWKPFLHLEVLHLKSTFRQNGYGAMDIHQALIPRPKSLPQWVKPTSKKWNWL